MRYKFRAECFDDVINFAKITKLDYLEILKPEKGFPDVEVIIESPFTLDILKILIRQVQDGYTMLETINEEKYYTGERNYKP